MSLLLETFEVGPMSNNLYLLGDEAARELIVIDPSVQSEAAVVRAQALIRDGFSLTGIWNTHGHVDHVHDNALWKENFGAPISMHEGDDFWLEHLREQSLWLGLGATNPVSPDARFDDGQTVKVGAHAARVLHLPGHSPGSVGFYFEAHNFIISGDVLFRGSVGRTDLPGCDFSVLQNSLRRLSELPPATRVLPGHGEETTIEREKQSNPLL